MSSGLPLLFDASGPVVTPPATIQDALLTAVAAEVPGYTANLPGSLIDDISGTDVGAITIIDQARVDAVNSVTPYGANPPILAAMGVMFGLPEGIGFNGSVFVVFTGSAGYYIPSGFIVSDGTNTYAIQDGGAVSTGGTSDALFAVAQSSGTFAIPANTVTAVETTVPSPYTLTVTNPEAGIPAQAAETVESYRARMLQAFNVSIVGTASYVKTLVQAVAGVSSRLVAIIQSGSNWEVIVGGGDPYQVAGAIYAGVSTPGLLVGSSTSIRNQTVSIYDAPDTYSIVYVIPPAQVVTLAIVWNTTLSSFTAATAVNQFMVTASIAYINGILVGQPINELVLFDLIQAAVQSVLPSPNLTTLEFTWTIDGTPTTPTSGTFILPSDPESYFSAAATAVTSAQG